MNFLALDKVTHDPEQTLAALARLEKMLDRADPEAEATDLLHFVPGKRAIFRGTFKGRDVVFRLPLNDTERAHFSREWDEINRAYAYMSAPPYTVAEPIHFDPNTGVYLVPFLPGRPLLSRLKKLAPDARQPLLTHAAKWLLAYTTPTMGSHEFKYHGWFRKAARAAELQPHPALRAIESRVLRRMKRLGRKLHHQDVRHAICHGDFHLNNVMVHRNTLTGFDTGGSATTPIVKDIARALTHMARSTEPWSGRRHFGVDAGAFAIFADAFDLTPHEREAQLPFMLALETLVRVEPADLSQDRLEKAEKLARRLFRDLRQIA